MIESVLVNSLGRNTGSDFVQRKLRMMSNKGPEKQGNDDQVHVLCNCFLFPVKLCDIFQIQQQIRLSVGLQWVWHIIMFIVMSHYFKSPFWAKNVI